MFQCARKSLLLGTSLLVALACAPSAWAQGGPTPGQNINMVSGTGFPGGDPFLQRQNEPSIAVSTRNPRHLLAGANDYRTVDLNFFATGETGDAWLGLFKSFDGGASWVSTLLPGYPLDQTPEGKSSPLKAFNAASDPVVRPGTNGLFFYSGIAFNRGTNTGAVFVSRYIDLNNRENGTAAPLGTPTSTPPSTSFEATDPIRYIGTTVLDTGNAGQFLDKPWFVADVPRLGAGSCTVTVAEPGSAGGTVTQSFPAGNVYIAWTRFVGGQNLIRTQIYVSRSLDCGATWSTPDKVSEGYPVNQGTALAVDPLNGNLYVAWRTFAAASTPDGISVAVSTDGGQTFSKGNPVTSLSPFNSTNLMTPSFFDLQSTGSQMRTLAFPTIAVDNAQTVYVAWAQRVPPNGDARVMISNSTNNGLNWSVPAFVDNNTLTDDSSGTFSRGHQFMPQLTFSGGKLMALYYDLRLDHTLGFFTPNAAPNCGDGSNNPFCADSNGRFYKETRTLKGELSSGNPTAVSVFNPYLDDAGLPQRRHTIEVFVAQADPPALGSLRSFSAGTRVTNYRFGLRNGATDPAEIQQLQVDPPNFPLFKGGTTPFFGDYIDIAGLQMVLANGSWGFNTGSGSANAPVFHAAWTDNRDVRPPKDGNWQNYTPVGGGGVSIFSPGTPTPSCTPNQEGMRNENIYTSRITQGLLVSSPQNTKPLSASLQRAFVVLVQNQTNKDKSFRLTIPSQPPGGFASFTAGTNNPGPNPAAGPPTPPSPVLTTFDIQVSAHSGVAASVFAVSTSPTASITVNVDEITAVPGGTIVAGGLSSFVVLNADATTPTLINPEGAPAGTDIATNEFYNPNFSNPNYSNPNYSNPNYSNPNFSNPNYSNPNFSNPNFSNPDIATSTVGSPNYSNGDLSNPNYSNPNYSNPNFSNSNLSNTSFTDASYTLTNKSGNTNAGYDVNLVKDGTLPSNVKLQLLINKTYLTPVAQSCALAQEQTTTVVSVNNNPNFSDPNFSNPNFSNPSMSQGSVSLAPGESATIVVRGFNVTCAASNGNRCNLPTAAGVPNMEDIITQVLPVVTAQAANTNDPTNSHPTIAPLFITTASLPDGVASSAYSTTLSAIGGNLSPTSVGTWTLISAPASLSLSSPASFTPGNPGTSSVTLSGSLAAGTYPFTAQVQDSAANTATRQFTLRIAAPLVITAASPLATATQGSAPPVLNFTETGGIAPYNWNPVTVDGMTLNSSGGFSGTPTLTGTFTFTAQVTDSASPSQTAMKSITFSVVPSTGSAPASGTLLCDNFNTAGVTQQANGPIRPTCTLSATKITQLATYHYNNGAGATPGTISIQRQDGLTFGPFAATGVAGQNGANEAWVATPNVIVPAGTYTVIDSDPVTWSFNSGSNNAGFVRLWGFAVGVPTFTATQSGPAQWTYTLTFAPLVNYSIFQSTTTITLTGLVGVTSAAGPTTTDFPVTVNPDLNAVNLNWSATVNGGTVVFTHVGPGTGNFPDFRHAFGFTINASGAGNGTAQLATTGFSRDTTNPLPDGTFNLDITDTANGPTVPPIQ
jgi:uncharacterized protein YjbI with pentapeptide repeats